tara:strand:- start:2346 stop:2531 length:186 start_codon:yes stop_codon:yes gene_type:complete
MPTKILRGLTYQVIGQKHSRQKNKNQKPFEHVGSYGSLGKVVFLKIVLKVSQMIILKNAFI